MGIKYLICSVYLILLVCFAGCSIEVGHKTRCDDYKTWIETYEICLDIPNCRMSISSIRAYQQHKTQYAKYCKES